VASNYSYWAIFLLISTLTEIAGILNSGGATRGLSTKIQLFNLVAV
jgi:hypothetical protein